MSRPRKRLRALASLPGSKEVKEVTAAWVSRQTKSQAGTPCSWASAHEMKEGAAIWYHPDVVALETRATKAALAGMSPMR